MFSELWTQFGIDNVDIHQVKNIKIPKPDPKIPSRITIRDTEGKVLLTFSIPEEEDSVVYR